MPYLGSWKIDDVLTFYANTTRFDTGAATDADGDPAYRVYENETGTPLLTGTMSLLDSSNTAGFYSEAITLSAANGFEKGKCYAIYKSAAVNSVTGATHDTFQVEAEVDANRINWANVDNPTTTLNLSGTSTLALEPTTAGRKLDVSAAGEAGLDWANIGSPTTTVNLSGTTVKTATDVATKTAFLPSVTAGAVGGLPILLANGEVNASVELVRGDPQAAVNLLAALDGTGYNVGGGDIVVDSVTGAVGSVTVVSDKTGYELSEAGAEALLDPVVETDEDGNEVTVRRSHQLSNANASALVSGAGTSTVVLRNLANDADLVTATVDSNANRTAVVRNFD